MKTKTTEPSKEVFVFGSNLAGRHGRGAAWVARMSHGAVYGQGEGLQGNSYAIPTKDSYLHVLPLEQVKRHVDKFIRYANKHPELTFNVTAIGTGLAGFTHDDIAPMFAFAPINCKLPIKWKEHLPHVEGRSFWNS